jgi:hypothetical protein
MAEEHFEVVTIETDQPGRLLSITNTRQVAERLTENWPAAHRGTAYKRAVKAAMDHLRGKKDANELRKAFVAAAKEADIFVREGRHHG